MNSLVIGKFYPFHIGHEHLIKYALQHSNNVYVVVLGRHDEDPKFFGSNTHESTLDTRVRWIEKTFDYLDAGDLTVVGQWNDVDEDYESEEIWQLHVDNIKTALGNVDIHQVVSSEMYGKKLATYFNSNHHTCTSLIYDIPRMIHNTSGTIVRGDLTNQWHMLPDAVRRDLVIRVVIVGGECAGKSTLANDLGTRLSLLLSHEVPVLDEYGRSYVEHLVAQGIGLADIEWDNATFDYIAYMQRRNEIKLLREASSRYIVLDTDFVTTEVWRSRYLNTPNYQFVTNVSIAMSIVTNPTIYIIPDIDEIEFENDGTRDGESIRHAMHETFINIAKEHNIPYVLVKGSRQERVDQAINFIDCAFYATKEK